MDRLSEMRKKYGAPSAESGMTRLEKMRAQYSVAEGAADVLSKKYTQTSGVYDAPETFTRPASSLASVQAAEAPSEVVAGTGLGIGVMLPTQSKAAEVGASVSKQMHEQATQDLEQLKKDKRSASWKASTYNPESEDFKTNDDWGKERTELEDKRDAAAKNYYIFAGQDSVNKVLSTPNAAGAFKIATEAAAEISALKDKYRNGGWNPEASTALKNAAEKQARAVELLVSYGVDKDTADRAVEYQASQIRQGKAAAKAQETAEWAKEHKGAASLLSVVTGQTGGMDYLNALAGNAGHNSTKNIEAYRPLTSADFQNTAYTEALRSGASADLGKVGSVIYDLGMSMADSVFRAYLLGPISGVLSGSSVAASMANDALNRGGTNGQALTLGFAAGLAEMLFETYSIEKFINSDASTIRNWLKSIPTQGSVEASEEAFTEIANILADAAVMGKNSNFDKAVAAYQRDGLSEEAAMRKAALDNIAQVVMSAAGGFITGAVMSAGKGVGLLADKGIQSATDYAVKNQIGRALSQQQYDMLVVAQRFAEGSDTRVLADKIASSVEQATQNGKVPTISAATWGELATLMESQRDEFGPKLGSGEADPAIEQTLHPDDAVMSATADVFRDAGDDPKTADAKSKILDKIAAGDTTVTDTELRKLDLNSQSTRAAFKTVLGVELPGVTDRAVLFSAARDAAQSIADANAVQAQPEQVIAQPEQVATPERVQAQPEQTAVVPEQVQAELDAIEEEARRMADAVAPAAAQDEGRASVGEIPSAQETAQSGPAAAQESGPKSLLDYVGGVIRSNADARTQAQNLTVDTLNTMLSKKGSRSRIRLESLGKDGGNAYWMEDGSIVLNKDLMETEEGGTQFAIYWSLSHELLHEATSRKGGTEGAWVKQAEKDLNAIAEQVVGKDQWEAMRKSAYKAQLAQHVRHNMEKYPGMSKSEATALAKGMLTDAFMEEEYAADALRWVFAHTDALNRFVGEYRSTAVKIRDWLQNKFSDLLTGSVAADKTTMRTMNDLVKKVNEALTNTTEKKAEAMTEQADKPSKEAAPAERFSAAVSPDSVPDWDAQVNAFMNGTFDELFWGDGRRRSSMYVMFEPTALLQDIGLSDLPLVMTQDHAKGFHGLTEPQFRNLPELIRHPVAVFRDDPNGDHAGGINILTSERDENGDPIFIAIKPDQPEFTWDKESGPAHFVNVFGRKHAKAYVNRVIEDNGVLFVDKEKFDADPWLAQIVGPSLSTADSIESGTIINQKRPTVKPGERRYSVPALADTDTEEFRAWFNDDSGELTNPDGTPKMLLRGSPLSGSTKFRDYRESYSPGIFLTPDLYAAKNYATARSTRSDPVEFVPRVLNSWRDAYWWVENGGLGDFVSLEQEGPDEWVFAKRNAELPTRWDTVATFTNDQAGLDKFNAEYGDLMRNEVFGTGKAQNPGYMKLYATATKTKVIDAEGRVWLNADGQWGKTDDVVRQAWDEGYDCVVIKNVQDGGEEIGVGFDENDNWVTQQKPIDVIIVKDSGQVKSVYNTGTFDRSNPDVRYSADPKKPTYKTGGNTGNVNPDTGFERGSVADSFVRMWNVGAEDEALNMLESMLSRLAQINAEQAEERVNQLRRAAFAPRVTESVAERNKARIERLIEKYGAMEQTSAAQQEVRIPKQIDSQTRVAGAVQTAMAAEVTNEVIRDEIIQDILNGSAGVTYSRVGDKTTLDAVDKEFEKRGFDAMMRDWRNQFESDKAPTKLDIARAEKLYVEACEAKDVDNALKLVAEIAAAGTRAGQAVQAMTLLKKMTPTGQLYYIQKAVDRLNREPRQKKAIVIDEALAKKLVEAKTREELNAAVDALIGSIAEQVPVSLQDKWNTWRYFAMLGNPRTHIRNLLGNVVFTPARLAKDIIGTGLEHMLIKDAGQRTKSVTVDKAMLDFTKQDAEEMQDILRGGGKYNPSDMIRDRRKIFKRAEWLNKATGFNSELLEKEDWIFLKAAYARSMAGFLTARGVTSPDTLMDTKEGRKLFEDARAYAVREAQRATYRDASKMASTLNNFKRNHAVLGALLDGLVPFTKTPINIVKRGLEYSPIGLLKTGADAVTKLRNGEMTAAEVIDELAANLTGTGVALLGALLSHFGLLVSGLGADDEDKFKELYGEQAYSLNIPGVGSYTIDWMAPVALPLFVGSEIYNTLTGDYSDVDAEQVLSAVMDGMASILEPMLSLSMLDGLNDALSANKFGDSEDAIWTMLASMSTSYVSQGLPTVFGQIARTADPTRRTTFIQQGEGKVEGMLKRFWQSSVQGKVPFYENGKMAYVDAWGRTDTTGSILVRAFENFISPGYVNASRQTDVEVELARLSGELKDTGVLPDRAEKYFTVDKEKYAMTQDEYEAHLIDRGQTSYRLVSDFIHDPMYASLSDEERADVIKDIYEYAAQNACYNTNAGYDRNPWVTALDEYVANGGDAVDYLSVRVKSGNGVSMSEVAYGRDDLSQRDVGAILRLDTNASQRTPEKFADPGSSGREYSMTAEQQAYYTDLWDDMFDEEFTDLYNSRKYQNADPEERAELVKALRADVTKEVKRDVERWLRQQGVKSTKK